jgi:hypothetical protein
MGERQCGCGQLQAVSCHDSAAAACCDATRACVGKAPMRAIPCPRRQSRARPPTRHLATSPPPPPLQLITLLAQSVGLWRKFVGPLAVLEDDFRRLLGVDKDYNEHYVTCSLNASLVRRCLQVFSSPSLPLPSENKLRDCGEREGGESERTRERVRFLERNSPE